PLWSARISSRTCCNWNVTSRNWNDKRKADPELARKFCHLVSVRGIARVSALHILAELVVLAPDLTSRQWVAHAGLDPRHHESGTSVHKPARISPAGNRYRDRLCSCRRWSPLSTTPISELSTRS